MLSKEDGTRRVLMISHDMTRTGAPLMLFELANVLRREGYCPIVFSPIYGEIVEDFTNAGIETFPCEPANKKSSPKRA